MTDLLRQARRRYLLLTVLDYSTYAIGAALLAVILLLVVGTQILNWYWPVILGVLVMAYVAWRARRRMPPLYRLAQTIDAHYGWHDALSTAFHFDDSEQRRRIPEDVWRTQRNAADELTSQVSLPSVFAFRMPRAAWPLAALSLAAAGLFALRYGVTHRLDLQKPLVAFSFDQFSRAEQKEAAKRQTGDRQKANDLLNQNGLATEQSDGRSTPDPKGERASVQTAQANSADQQTSAKDRDTSKQQGAADQASQDEPKSGSDEQQSASNGQPESGDQGNSAGKNEASQQNAESKNAQAADARGNENSLLNKMRDALSNMLNQMKNLPKPSTQQSAANQQGKPGQGQQPQQGQKGANTDRAQNDQTGNGSQQQGEQQGQSGEKAQSASSKEGDKSAQQSSQDTKSGMGKQDGAKDLKDAEQMAAMGKISELLGKRSQNVSGEISVEVPSGNQQLSTPYQQRRANHTEAGSEVHRDEIPLAYQSYVQRYFEQVHKSSKK